MTKEIHANPDLLKQINPTAVLVDRHQQVWAVARPIKLFGDGLWRLQDGLFRPAGYSTSEMSVLFADHTNRLWVGTDGGLGSWDGSQLTMLTTADGPFRQ